MNNFKYKNIFDNNLFYWFSILIIPIGFWGALSTFLKSHKISYQPKNYSIRTKSYQVNGDYESYCNKIEEIIPKLTNYGMKWKLIFAEGSLKQNLPYVIHVEVPVFFFTDDLKIIMKPSSNGKKIQISAYSRSRVGKNDLGENRRHIATLFNLLNYHFQQ